VLRLSRFLPGAIVAGVLIAIVWTIGRSSVVTQWFPTAAPQASRAPDGAGKDGRQTGAPGEAARPRAVATESALAPPVTGSEPGADDDINSKLAAIEKKLSAVAAIEKKLNDLAEGIDAIRQTRAAQRGAPAPTPSAWPRLELWVLSALGLATFSAVVAVLISIRSRQREGDETGTRAGSQLRATAPTNAAELLLSKFKDQSDRADQVERTLARLQATVQGLVAEIKKLPAGISSGSAAPVERAPAAFEPPSRTGDVSPPPGRSPPPPTFDDRAAAVLVDFNEMAANDSGTRAFQDRWHPQSVVMANFDQRVRESGFTPELFVRNLPVGGNDEHFWFIPLAPSQGYILPARRLLQHRSALRGEGAAKLFRMIFEIVPAEGFSVERPAHGRLDGSQLRVLQQGTIRLPQ
jgi:hypothetical protein